MKKIIFIAIVMISFAAARAQSGLQFSRAIFTPLSYTATGTQVLGTVPAGKVWKVEQVVTSAMNLNYFFFQFNGNATNISIPFTSATTGALFFMSSQSPMWWPAGTAVNVYYNYSASGINATIYFSILEFTVTP